VVACPQGESGSASKQDKDVDVEDLSAVRMMVRIRYYYRCLVKEMYPFSTLYTAVDTAMVTV
jgi:hypothetical protein